MELFKHSKTGNILELKRSGKKISVLYALNEKGDRFINSLTNFKYQTRIVNNKYLIKL